MYKLQNQTKVKLKLMVNEIVVVCSCILEMKFSYYNRYYILDWITPNECSICKYMPIRANFTYVIKSN